MRVLREKERRKDQNKNSENRTEAGFKRKTGQKGEETRIKPEPKEKTV